MKRCFSVLVIFLMITFALNAQAVTGLLSLEQAITEAAAAVEAKMQRGAEIAIAKIDAPLPDISDFLNNELIDSFSSRGKLVVLARGKEMAGIDSEHNLQMSGMVSDASAIGIGHYLGAKVVVTGTFDRYSNFSQLRIRAVEVKTSALLATYSARIRNNDPILSAVTKPLENTNAPVVTENALAYLNRGKDYYAAGKYDEAIRELNQALSANKDLKDGYFYRGLAYYDKRDYDRAIADYDAAIKLDSNYANAYINRGIAYRNKGDYDRAIADYDTAIKLDSNYALAYYNRGLAYDAKRDYDRASADWEAVLRLDPNHANAKLNIEKARQARGY
jgi:tetratricopeptide (TPR) repeat protein